MEGPHNNGDENRIASCIDIRSKISAQKLSRLFSAIRSSFCIQHADRHRLLVGTETTSQTNVERREKNFLDLLSERVRRKFPSWPPGFHGNVSALFCLSNASEIYFSSKRGFSTRQSSMERSGLTLSATLISSDISIKKT